MLLKFLFILLLHEMALLTWGEPVYPLRFSLGVTNCQSFLNPKYMATLRSPLYLVQTIFNALFTLLYSFTCMFPTLVSGLSEDTDCVLLVYLWMLTMLSTQ